MRQLVCVLTLSAMLTGPAFAAPGHEDSSQHDAHQARDGQELNMQAHVEEMQALMARIHAEKDEKKREALISRHLASMRAGMGEMTGMHRDHAASDMNTRMRFMEQRVEMLETMMGQMLSHESEERKEMLHKHKRR